MFASKRKWANTMEEEVTKRADSTDIDEQMISLSQKWREAVARKKEKADVEAAAAARSARTGPAQQKSSRTPVKSTTRTPVKSTRFATPQKPQQKRTIAKVFGQPVEEEEDDSGADSGDEASLEDLDFGFEMEKPGRDAVMHDNDNTAQDQASTRLQQLLSEKEAAIGRSLMSKQDGLHALKQYLDMLKTGQEEQKEAAKLQISSAASSISNLNKTMIHEYGPKVQNCVQELEGFIGGHLTTMDGLLTDMNESVKGVAEELSRLEGQIRAVKQSKIELLQNALREFQAMKKRHAMENELVHERLEDLREKTQQELHRATKKSQALFAQQFKGAHLLPSQL